jgi:hypothetical protein
MMVSDMLCHFDEEERAFTITENGNRTRFDSVRYEIVITKHMTIWSIASEELGKFSFTRTPNEEYGTWQPIHGSVNRINYGKL